MRARVEIPVVKTPDGTAGVVVVHGRHDVLSDSYRTLRNVVTFIQSGAEQLQRAHVTVIVSPGQGDGKTALAANLAAAWVETGRRTIAVNTDFRRPRLTQAVNGEPPAELPFDLEELELIDPTLLLRQTRHSKLLMLDLSPIAAPPSELVRSSAVHLPTLSGIADEIVIDTSPVGLTAEPLEVVPFADVIILVVRLGHTLLEDAERTLTRLRDVSTAPVILALTGVKPSRGKYVEYGDDRQRTSWPWPSPRMRDDGSATRAAELSSS